MLPTKWRAVHRCTPSAFSRWAFPQSPVHTSRCMATRFNKTLKKQTDSTFISLSFVVRLPLTNT